MTFKTCYLIGKKNRQGGHQQILLSLLFFDSSYCNFSNLYFVFCLIFFTLKMVASSKFLFVLKKFSVLKSLEVDNKAVKILTLRPAKIFQLQSKTLEWKSDLQISAFIICQEIGTRAKLFVAKIFVTRQKFRSISTEKQAKHLVASLPLNDTTFTQH